MARKSGAVIEQGIINLHFKKEAADMAERQTEEAAELAKAVALRIEQQINKIGSKPRSELTPEERQFLANQALKSKIPS